MSMRSPGPWRAINGLITDVNGDVVLAFVREANAPLIAAAPELLEALKGAMGQLEGWITSELGGTRQLSVALAELRPWRDLVARVENE